MDYYYIQRGHAWPVCLPYELDSNYLTGETWQDYLNGAWVPLGPEQEIYAQMHPEARVSEVWNLGLTPKPPLEEVKLRKLADLYDYDTSSEVNGFTLNGQPMWLSREDRAALKMRLEAEEESGLTSTCIWHEGGCFETGVAEAKAMLRALELYARACYDNTQRHAQAISALSTEEELMAYDYMAGYPPKLVF